MALSCGIKWSYFNDLLELRKKSVVNGWFPTNPGKTPQSDNRYITQLTITIVNYSIPWKSHYKRTPNPKQCIISQFFLGQMPSNQQHVASSVELTLPLNIDGWTTIRLCFGGPDFFLIAQSSPNNKRQLTGGSIVLPNQMSRNSSKLPPWNLTWDWKPPHVQ